MRTDYGATYVRFGVSRRLFMILSSFNEIVRLIPLDRQEPLVLDESNLLMKELNSLYINIRGVLDNLAWAALNDFGIIDQDDIRPQSVHVFSKELKECEQLIDLYGEIGVFENWGSDLGERRNPAAHRIPLTIPPSLLNPEEGKRYQELFNDYWNAAANQQFDQAKELMDAIDQVGKFVPVFTHHPHQQPMLIFPTLPTDSANTIKISRAFLSKLDTSE